jgi:hypothetical protein
MKTVNELSIDGILPMTKEHWAVRGVDVYFVADLAWFYTNLGPIFYKADDIELLRTFIVESIGTGMYQAEAGALVWCGPKTYTEFLKTV